MPYVLKELLLSSHAVLHIIFTGTNDYNIVPAAATVNSKWLKPFEFGKNQFFIVMVPLQLHLVTIMYSCAWYKICCNVGPKVLFKYTICDIFVICVN